MHAHIFRFSCLRCFFFTATPILGMDESLEELVRAEDSIDCVMNLADEGVLNLLDPVGKWFPEFRGKCMDDLPLGKNLDTVGGLC